MKTESKCTICRRAGEKLFLKGERCFTPKCAMVRHPAPPGIHGNKRGRRTVSEYGAELREKQKIRFMYGITETQLANYVRKARAKKGAVSSEAMIQFLESRLDNVVFRAGLAISRSIARHLVTYGHIVVNDKPVSIPSYQVSVGDIISISPESKNTPLFKDIGNYLKKYEPPQWIEMDKTALKAIMKALPSQESIQFSYDLQKVFEFYSR